MVDAIPYERAQVFVNETVMSDPSDLVATHRSPLAKEAQLMAERRNAHAQDQRHVADAQLIADREEMQDTGSRWVAQDGEEGGHGMCAVHSEGSAQERSDALGMQALHVAPVRVDSRRKYLSHGSSIAPSTGTVIRDPGEWSRAHKRT